MKYLTAEEILVLNAKVIEKTGGSQGIRDTNLLLSLVERPKTALGGQEMYKDVCTKAAVYFDSLAHYHVFIDGNKRTSLIASARFLYLNRYNLEVSNKEAERFTLEVAIKKLDIKKIATWLEKSSKSK